MSSGSDLSDKMNSIREARTYKAGRKEQKPSQTVVQIKSLIEPIVQDFVGGDNALLIQSSNSTSYFISYGLLYVCRVEISATETSGKIIIQGDPNFSSLYSFATDEMDEAAVRNQVKEGLLGWYQGCFS